MDPRSRTERKSDLFNFLTQSLIKESTKRPGSNISHLKPVSSATMRDYETLIELELSPETRQIQPEQVLYLIDRLKHVSLNFEKQSQQPT